jgi:transposase
MKLMENTATHTLKGVWAENAQLQQELRAADEKVKASDEKIVQLNQEISHLKEQLAWLKRQIFGKRSERIVSHLNQDQLLFEGFEPGEPKQEEEREIPAHKRRKSKRNGQDAITLPPDLPVQITILDIPEKEKICPETGEALVQIGVEVTHKLAHQPGSYYVKEIIRPKYAYPQREEAGIAIAALPDSLIPKCRADESLLAEIITCKFADHLPLYRIVESMARQGIQISRKLLSQWVMRCGSALKPLYNEMVKRILAGQNVYIDETPIKLQEAVKCSQGYLWTIVGGGESSNPPYRVYDFRENRCHNHAFDLLKDYHGIVHSDKYGAYEKLAERKLITWCPCWSHIRRKFFEAETGDPEFRKWVLRKIRYLFMFEKVAWARPPDERLRIRREKEIPIIDELIEKVQTRLVQGKLLPKSKLREALGYFCGLIPYLKNYTKNVFSRLDNNVAERAIRPLAIGRKNWLFFGSPEAAEAGAILFSLVQSCRGLGINPREYLEDVMRRLMSHSIQKLHELLPDEWLASRTRRQEQT